MLNFKCKKNAMRLDLDLPCLKMCEKESAVQKFPVFIAANLSITWHNCHTLENANYLLETCPTGGCGCYLWEPYWKCSRFWSILTCSGSIILLLFMISHIGHSLRCVKAITNALWLAKSHLVIFVPLFLVLSINPVLSICKQTSMVYNWYD